MSVSASESHLIDLVRHLGHVSEDDMVRVSREHTDTSAILRALVDEGALRADDARRIHAIADGIPWVDLTRMSLRADVLGHIPEPVARAYNAVAFCKHADTNTLEVAMLDATNPELVREIAAHAGCTIVPRMTSDESLRHGLLEYQRHLERQFGAAIRADVMDVSETEDAPASTVRPYGLMERIVAHAVVQNATDIHLDPQARATHVRYRIHNVLHDAMTLPRHVAPALVACIREKAGIPERGAHTIRDGRMRIMHDGEQIDIRVSCMPVADGEKVVLRILRPSTSGLTIESLGFAGESAEHVHRALREPVGLTLVTGPMRSGTSTTLYAFVDICNTPDANCVTIEDPIEYEIPRANQTYIDPERGLTFAHALRLAGRQDPDMVMVSEIRDPDAAVHAARIAHTRCRVCAGMRAESVSEAIVRMMDMHVDPSVVAQALTTVVNQRVVPAMRTRGVAQVLTSHQYDILRDEADMERVLTHLKEDGVVDETATWKTIPFYRDSIEEGSRPTYTMIAEVCRVTPSVRERIARRASADVIERVAREDGMRTLLEDAVYKAVRGDIALDTLLAMTEHAPARRSIV